MDLYSQEIEMTLESGEVEILPLKATASTVLRFRQFTGKELVNVLTSVIESLTSKDVGMFDSGLTDLLESVSQIAYVMNKQATAKTVQDIASMNKDDYLVWLDKYPPMEFLDKAGEIIDVYMNNTKTSSDAKKNPGQPSDR